MLFPTGEKYLLRNKYSVGENDDLNYQGYQEKNKEKTVCIPCLYSTQSVWSIRNSVIHT